MREKHSAVGQRKASVVRDRRAYMPDSAAFRLVVIVDVKLESS